MTALPLRSRTTAPAGMVTLPAGPMAVIRLSVMTMSPRSMTSAPFIVMMRALRSAMVPFGLSLSTMISTSTRCGSYSNVGGFGVGEGDACGEGDAGDDGDVGDVGDGRGDGDGWDAARSASASAVARFAASTSAARARSCTKKLRPIE